MKAKIIKSVLRRKLKAWVESIDNEDIKKVVSENAIITGGAIVSLLLNEEVKDFDVYFRTPEAAYKVADYYLKKFMKESNGVPKFEGNVVTAMYLADIHKHDLKSINEWIESCAKTKPENNRLRIVVKSAGIAGEESGQGTYKYFEASSPEDAADYVEEAIEKKEDEKKEKPSYRPVYMTSNAITLADGIQIVIRFYGEVNKIHENYDYAHCLNYWQSWDGKLDLNPVALECIINKELRYIGSKYPLCSLFRMRKFLKRGWTINVGQILKIALQITTLKLSDISVLEDQLIGVDTAYFAQVIDLCQKKAELSKSDEIDYTYLIEIIDRVF